MEININIEAIHIHVAGPEGLGKQLIPEVLSSLGKSLNISQNPDGLKRKPGRPAKQLQNLQPLSDPSQEEEANTLPEAPTTAPLSSEAAQPPELEPVSQNSTLSEDRECEDCASTFYAKPSSMQQYCRSCLSNRKAENMKKYHQLKRLNR